MKKLFVSFAVVAFCASFVFAQNTATTNQTGDNGQATIAQTGSNTASVTQVESATNTPVGQQIADVKQNGATNSATVSQTETGGGNHGTNRAKVDQDGSNNSVTQTTYAPGSNSGQNVDAYQKGDWNMSMQSISAGYTNSFTLKQIGNHNTSSQTMAASHSHGNIFSEGDFNFATQSLTGSNHGYSGGININQYGNQNQASQSFSGGGLGHNQKGNIYQDGDDE